jgi:hypothetical protein
VAYWRVLSRPSFAFVFVFKSIWEFVFEEINRLTQWPHGLRHEPSSPARTLGSWVRITLESWIAVCIYFVFVLCMQVAALRQVDSPPEESYRLCIDHETEKATNVHKGCRAIDCWMDGWTDGQ